MSLKELSKVEAKEGGFNEPATPPADDAGDAKEGRGGEAPLS